METEQDITKRKVYYKKSLNAEEKAALDASIEKMKKVLGDEWDELYDSILTAIHHNIGLTLNQLKNKITDIYLDKLHNGNIEQRIINLEKKGVIDKKNMETIINVYLKKEKE